MLDVGSKVAYLHKGISYQGVIKHMKWGMAFVDFKGSHESEWITLTRLRKI